METNGCLMSAFVAKIHLNGLWRRLLGIHLSGTLAGCQSTIRTYVLLFRIAHGATPPRTFFED